MSYLRKIITIDVFDSPNVQLAQREIALGRKPSNTIVLDGVITWEEFQERERTWDEVRKTIGLYAKFYKGAQLLLFPPKAMERAHLLATEWGNLGKAESVGIDPGEGQANTSMCAGNKRGIIELVNHKTPDTSMITGEAIAFGKKHNVPPEKWFFDAGGGGKQHVDRLRAKGYNAQMVRFGESIVPRLKRGKRLFQERVGVSEEKGAYKNRRAEMYGIASLLLDPTNEGFAIPRGDRDPDNCPYTRLRNQLSVIPRLYDGDGRMLLPPKNPPPGKEKSDGALKSLVELIGYSPDEADSFVLMVHGLTQRSIQARAGAAV